MKPSQREKDGRLNQVILQVTATEQPIPNFEKWQQDHPHAIESLKSGAKQRLLTTRPSVTAVRVMKIAAAVLIIAIMTGAVLLWDDAAQKREQPIQPKATAAKPKGTPKDFFATPIVDTVTTNLVELDIKLPTPLPISKETPQINIEGCVLEPLKRLRPPFYVPIGTKNVAFGKPVTSSVAPVNGKLEMITDGDKKTDDRSYVELGPFLQHVTIDLGAEYNIYGILVWHYYGRARVYFDVIVQTSCDPNFTTGVQTLFNNDIDNSSGFGIGKDKHYVETYMGKLIDGRVTPARYVRLCSNGNNANDLNHYIEIEVFGKPVNDVSNENIPMSHGPAKDGLAAFLMCAQHQFKLDEPVPLLYGVVYNRSGRIIRIVPPYGAVDPGNRSWLSVTGPDGNDVPYIGIYVKSPRPDSGDVLRLGSGSFHGYLTSNIRDSFELRTSGTYTIKWHCEMIPVGGVSCWTGELVSNEIQIEIVK